MAWLMLLSSTRYYCLKAFPTLFETLGLSSPLPQEQYDLAHQTALT